MWYFCFNYFVLFFLWILKFFKKFFLFWFFFLLQIFAFYMSFCLPWIFHHLLGSQSNYYTIHKRENFKKNVYNSEIHDSIVDCILNGFLLFLVLLFLTKYLNGQPYTHIKKLISSLYWWKNNFFFLFFYLFCLFFSCPFFCF